MRLYDLETKLDEIMHELEENGGELTPALEQALSEIELAREKKIDGMLAMYRSYLAKAEAAKAELEYFKKLKERNEKASESLEKFLLYCLGPEAKLETRFGKLTFRKTDVCECCNESLVPDAYKKETLVVKPNIAMAKQTFKEGGEVPGFVMKNNFHLNLR
jgi:hypothetical protein